MTDATIELGAAHIITWTVKESSTYMFYVRREFKLYISTRWNSPEGFERFKVPASPRAVGGNHVSVVNNRNPIAMGTASLEVLIPRGHFRISCHLTQMI